MCSESLRDDAAEHLAEVQRFYAAPQPNCIMKRIQTFNFLKLERASDGD